jgi:hypothetical protein
VHFIPLTSTIGSCKMSWFLKSLYKLDPLNYLSSCTSLTWLAQIFQKILSALQTHCKTIEWSFFLLKKLHVAKMTLQLGHFANKMCVPSIALATFGNLVSALKLLMMLSNCAPSRMLIHWLNSFCLSTRMSQTMLGISL